MDRWVEVRELLRRMLRRRDYEAEKKEKKTTKRVAGVDAYIAILCEYDFLDTMFYTALPSTKQNLNGSNVISEY